MMGTPSWATRAALDWLQAVLLERFGHPLRLSKQDESTLLMVVDGQSAGCITLSLDSATFTRADSDLPCTQWNAIAEGWHAVLSPVMPAPGASNLSLPLIEPTAQGWHIHYDILGLTYWMLSRQEEVGRTDLDEHGRFPATASHAFDHGYLERPVVDEWLSILGQVIQKTWPPLSLITHQFAMKVSHDVDEPSRYAFRNSRRLIRAMVGDLIKRGDVNIALFAPWVWLNSKARLHDADPANTFDWIMDVSEQHGLKSAFYFICGRTEVARDADYEPEHPAIRNLMRRIHARGHEIGLHPSYGSYQSPEIIAAESARLRRVANEEGIKQTQWGGRMHFLRWEQPITMQGWEKADASYDSTLSYADRPGFRCGTCFEYPAFDCVAGEALRLRIRPLIAMECTVMAPRYLGLGTSELARSKFIQLKNACRAVGGCFTLLWHNSQFETMAKRQLYISILNA
jgi:hypothetical protein